LNKDDTPAILSYPSPHSQDTVQSLSYILRKCFYSFMAKFSIDSRSTNFRFHDLFIGRCVEGLQTLTGEPCEASEIENFNFLKYL